MVKLPAVVYGKLIFLYIFDGLYSHGPLFFPLFEHCLGFIWIRLCLGVKEGRSLNAYYLYFKDQTATTIASQHLQCALSHVGMGLLLTFLPSLLLYYVLYILYRKLVTASL